MILYNYPPSIPQQNAWNEKEKLWEDKIITTKHFIDDNP